MSNLDVLQDQLLAAAEAFAGEAQPLGELLAAMAGDVERATAEPLEIFPVCHHSPASALHMVRRLRDRPPQVIYLEMCEDLLAAVPYLADCKLPVALQAFAAETEAFPAGWSPLSVVAPLTEASAEYQAMTYALQRPETELVFVDRAVDFVFQWLPLEERLPERLSEEEEPPSEEAQMHGTAVGVELGALEPTFDRFLAFLLRNANVRHFAEWWDQYVEQAIIGADYATYRQVMFLVGSLLRRLGRRDEDLAVDRQREQYMWTRLKEHLAGSGLDPADALYICGAAHSASDVAEFGLGSDVLWPIPQRTSTHWLYGLLPSSFAAIEYQFSHPAGTVSLAEATWQKSLRAINVRPFRLEKPGRAGGKDASGRVGAFADEQVTRKLAASQARKLSPQSSALSPPSDALLHFLTRSPALAEADQEQLLRWCIEIVALARKNGYLASTADSIAIYQTALLLANLRNRSHPSPYDFQDAAVTCLEKERMPKKRNVRQLCHILLGGDRIGSVGYTSLPPLAQNVYDRLAPLNVNLTARTNQRALMDFKRRPELLPCSAVLWRLNYLLGDQTVQPIMGERSLGHQPIQESWEIRIGKYQGPLIQLAYEGVTIEQVLEQRLKKAAFSDEARANQVLVAAEASLLYLTSLRLTRELGERAVYLLRQETSAEDAPAIFDRVRRLVHYYRATPAGLPEWIEAFVTTGYSHYATLLPRAFADRGTSPEQIAGMLGFIFTLESLALSLGCSRSELLIAVGQAGQVEADPAKMGLLWTAEWLLKLRPLEEIRAFFDHVLANPLLAPAFPDYLNGFILALGFAPQMAAFLVELLSKVFAAVPDQVLLPWLPNLILRLRPHSLVLQALMKEAATTFPNTLAGFEQWQPPWTRTQPAGEETLPGGELSDTEAAVQALLQSQPAALQALAWLLNHAGS
ncbi:MAG: DUF5682 family protein [Chloroflexi bacterium]|nr:DUF5682 family protein [Chloroflexota bacterium]MCI0730852.1 DUF5682 family protein [Chloroflexota bacterium]